MKTNESPERQSVRKAVERARWQEEFENPRLREERAQRVRELAPWHPTEPECRFMSKDERDRRWTVAVQSTARAVDHKKSVELRRAAYLGGVMTVAGRLSEVQVREHLHRAAAKAKMRPSEAERVIDDGFHSGRATAFKQLSRDGAVEGHPPGAFSAVASATVRYDLEIDMFVDPEALNPLPVATLVYLNHTFGPAPVAVAVPRMRGGLIEVDAVFSSSAGAAWTLTRTARLRSVSIFAHCQEYHRGLNGRLVKGVLTSVDLCESGKDDKAKVTAVVAADDLTPAQREVQRRFDRYLATDAPVAQDFIARADREGAAALEPLRPVVAPLLGPWTEPTPARLVSTSPSSQPLTRTTTDSRCHATLDGFTCQKGARHPGMHAAASEVPVGFRGSTSIAWDDRARSCDREGFRSSVA